MEGLNKQENANEKENVSIDLDRKELEGAFVGHKLETSFSDYLKVYTIINKVSMEGAKSEMVIKILAEDLFEKLDVEVLTYEDVFTKKVIKQLVNAKDPITSINFEVNYLPFTIKSGTTAENLMKEYEERTAEDPIKKVEREQKEKIEDERNAKEHAEKLTVLLEELQALDFANTAGVLDWLRKYNDIVSFVDVVNKHIEEVQTFFESKGYSKEKNDQMEYMIADGLKDKKRYNEVTIGFILANLGWIKEGQMNSLIDEWKNFE